MIIKIILTIVFLMIGLFIFNMIFEGRVRKRKYEEIKNLRYKSLNKKGEK